MRRRVVNWWQHASDVGWATTTNPLFNLEGALWQLHVLRLCRKWMGIGDVHSSKVNDWLWYETVFSGITIHFTSAPNDVYSHWASSQIFCMPSDGLLAGVWAGHEWKKFDSAEKVRKLSRLWPVIWTNDWTEIVRKIRFAHHLAVVASDVFFFLGAINCEQYN